MDGKTREVLKEIGLGKVEVEVYLDLLRGKASTASEIAKRTKQHRSNVYDALKSLGHKGFIIEVVDGKKLFEAKNPEIILNYVQQKASEVKDVLPFLDSLTRESMNPNLISISHGVTKCRTIFFDLINNKKEFRVWGISPKDMGKSLGEAFLKDWERDRIRKKVQSKIIYPEYFEEIKEIAQKKFQEVRYTKSKKSRTSVIISDDKIFFLEFSMPITIIEMHNKEISDWFLNQFDFAWRKSKKPLLIKEKVVRKTTLFKKKFKKNMKKLKNNNRFL